MRRNFNGVQINQSATIVERAGADIADCRNRIMAYDDKGDVILAEDGSKMPLGIALIESGVNDISGVESGKVAKGDDIDLQIKDIGYVAVTFNSLAIDRANVTFTGMAIDKGTEITAGAGGYAAAAKSGDYVLGTALNKSSDGGYCRVQINKYQKA